MTGLSVNEKHDWPLISFSFLFVQVITINTIPKIRHYEIMCVESGLICSTQNRLMPLIFKIKGGKISQKSFLNLLFGYIRQY